MKYKTLFSSAILFALFACFVPPSWAAPFDYYLKCDIRERDVFPPAGSNESFTRHEKYVVCIIEAVRNSSSIIASENQVIKGPSFDGKLPSEMTCPQIKAGLKNLGARITTLRGYQTAGNTAMASLTAGRAEVVRVASETEGIANQDKSACDKATEDLESLTNVTTPLGRCTGRNRADCVDDVNAPNPAYQRAKAEKVRLCNVTTGSKNRLIEVKESVKTMDQNISSLNGRLKTIQTEINKAQIQQNRFKEVAAEKSCPK